MNILVNELALIMGIMVQSGVDYPVDDLTCMARTVYHEARGENIHGQRATAHVVINRVTSDRFPNDVCAVVEQDLGPKPYDCQFSYTCDGLPDTPLDYDAYQQSIKVAIEVMAGISLDPTHGATFYVADHVDRAWLAKLHQTAHIGAHKFYRRAAVRGAQ